MLLGFGWRYVAYSLQKTAVVEPINPFECGELHSFEVAPWSSSMDDLGLVKPVDRLGESVVVGIADTSDGGLDARFRQSLGIANGDVLHTPIGMVDEPTAMDGSPIVKRLVQGIEDEARMGGPACPPTDDTASEGVDHKSHVDETLPGRHIGEIRKPKHIRRGCLKVAIDAVERTRCGFVRHGGFDLLATNDALKAHHSHEPCDGAAGDAVMGERSVTRAGIRIGRTQPATSAALSRLRALLNDELFIRGPDGLQPTPRAIDLAEPIGYALSQIQKTLEFTQTFDPSQSTATISIGLSEHAAFVLLPRLMAALRHEAPGMVMPVSNLGHRDDAVTLLDSGGVDLTVGVPHTPAGRILSESLFKETFVCIVRKHHSLVSEELTLDTFLQMSHLLVSMEGDRFGVVDAALAKQGLRRRLALTLPHMYAAPKLVASSDLVATLMRGIVEASEVAADLAVFEPPILLGTVRFDMSWHRRSVGSGSS